MREKSGILWRLIFGLAALVITCGVIYSNSAGGEPDPRRRSTAAPARSAAEPRAAPGDPAEDETHFYGQYDGRGGYLVAWLRGSSYAGYGGTDQVLGRVSASRPT